MSMAPTHFGFDDQPPMRKASEIAVRQASEKKRQLSVKKRQLSEIDPSVVGERVCDFLRRLHPDRTADNVAADLGGLAKPATIAKMLERQSAPGTVLWIALISAYGPEFLAAVLPSQMGWLDAATRAERQRACEQRIADLSRELQGLR